MTFNSLLCNRLCAMFNLGDERRSSPIGQFARLWRLCAGSTRTVASQLRRVDVGSCMDIAILPIIFNAIQSIYQSWDFLPDAGLYRQACLYTVRERPVSRRPHALELIGASRRTREKTSPSGPPRASNKGHVSVPEPVSFEAPFQVKSRMHSREGRKLFREKCGARARLLGRNPSHATRNAHKKSGENHLQR